MFPDGLPESEYLTLLLSAMMGISGLATGWFMNRPRHPALVIATAAALFGLAVFAIVRYLALWSDYTF